MTDTSTRTDLANLLERRAPAWRGADGLLELLAATATADEAVRHRLVAALAGQSDVAWSELRGWIEKWPHPASEPQALRPWLDDTEALGLSQLGLSLLALEDPAAQSTSAIINEVLAAFQEALGQRTDHAFFAGEAEARLQRFGEDVAPWSWFEGGSVRQLLDSNADAAREVCELWMASELHSADAPILAERAQTDTSFADIYRTLVARKASDIFVTRWNAHWSLDVARSAGELEAARRLLRVGLPHVDGELDVRHHAKGTWWTYPGNPGELVPLDASQHRWRVRGLGDVLTRIHVVEPDAAQDAWHGLMGLHRVAKGEAPSRGEEVAGAIVESLAHGPMAEAIGRASACFEAGTDLERVSERLLDHAFEARVTLPDALKALSDASIDVTSVEAALSEADEAHRNHASAAFLVSDDVYDDLAADLPLDKGAWWGGRAWLDARIPRGVVEGALHSIGDAGRKTTNAKVIPFRRPASESQSQAEFVREVTRLAAATHDPLFEDLPSEPCEWLAEAAPIPKAGCAPVLLFDEKRGTGVVAEIRISVADVMSESDLWQRAPMLQRIARETIRDAYYAAAAATPLRAAPHSFARHRIELVIDSAALSGAELEIDGRSLGLSAALAFVSAWLDTPIASDVAGLGTITRWGQLGSVRAIEEKVRSLVTRAGNHAIRVIGPKAAMDEIPRAGGLAVLASNLPEAIQAAGLVVSQLGDVPYGSVHDRLRAIRGLVSDIKTDNLGRHGESATWAGLADDLRRLIDSVDGEQVAESVVPEARCLAALAYSHAGLLQDVKEVLREVERPETLGLGVRSLYDIVNVGRHLDALSLESDTGRAALAALEEDLAELRASDANAMLGRATGTLGRARMHLRHPEEALPLLEEGVQHHLRHEAHESARSRVYLAMALRMGGDLPEALDELFRAQRELVTLTRRYSPEYESSCRVYLEYELARTLVVADRPADALSFANSALEQASPAWWPRLGILRARSWALRMCNQGAAADADVEAMRDLASNIAGAHGELARRLVEEAEGFPIADGEVY
ncbi:MAG: hypothetical protein GXP55_17510 [Deltaproteobacteria bacterium]|nr:hypothetical protein [Deltaproteobacteria bacterium]